MSVRMYPDVSILLTLDFEQPHLLRKCTIFKDSIQRQNITCYQLLTVKTIRNFITQEVVEAGGNSLRGLWNHLSMAKGGGVPHILEKAVITEADLLGINITDLEKALNQIGFDDKEDLDHLASLKWLKQNRGYTPIFATADRKLYECKDIIYQQTQIIVEDALYAAGTYRSLMSKPWPVKKAGKE